MSTKQKTRHVIKRTNKPSIWLFFQKDGMVRIRRNGGALRLYDLKLTGHVVKSVEEDPNPQEDRVCIETCAPGPNSNLTLTFIPFAIDPTQPDAIKVKQIHFEKKVKK
jgi:hypothetical protein